MPEILGTPTRLDIGIAANSGTIPSTRCIYSCTSACYIKWGGTAASSSNYDIMLTAGAMLELFSPSTDVSVIQVSTSGVLSIVEAL